MGKLFILHESFELKTMSPNERDSVVSDYCKCIDLVLKNKDFLYAHKDIENYSYSYGDLYNGLIYRSWKEISSNPNLNGISSNTHNLFFTSLYQIPGLIYEKTSYCEFKSAYIKEHYGFNGFKFKTEHTPYIYSEQTWKDWESQWLSLHQDEIKIDDVQDYFLPQKDCSITILKNELIKYKKDHLIKEKYNGNIAQAFHSEVMQRKGKELISYAIEISRHILNSNYYKFENSLSVKEQIACKSIRKIYSLTIAEKTRYISIDFEKGMFEFHNSKGKHLGEYKFDGSFNKKAETNHDFKTLK